ncbi:MAG: serine/threonine-protein kinase, partial [Myxococcota bacterium]
MGFTMGNDNNNTPSDANLQATVHLNSASTDADALPRPKLPDRDDNLPQTVITDVPSSPRAISTPPSGSNPLETLPAPEQRPSPSNTLLVSDPNPGQPSQEQQLPRTIGSGRYTLLKRLGSGGMGDVYKARDRALDEIVALKTLRQDLALSETAVKRFRQEVKLARRVTHPSVARTFDLGLEGEQLFLTMEYIAGQSLALYLHRMGAMTLSQTVSCLVPICEGLEAAHKVGVIHRDLKPENIQLTSEGRLVILDFGIAWTKSDSGRPNEVIGTLAYMAPEQLDSGVLGPWTDIYAMGCIAYHMLTGRMPWGQVSDILTAKARLHTAPPDPRQHVPGLSPRATELIQRCMALQPTHRPPSASALADALKGLIGTQDGTFVSAMPP